MLNRLLFVVLITALLRCTGTMDVAGGSGAGNPSGITTVAIIADTGSNQIGLSKTVVRRPLPDPTKNASQDVSTIRSFQIRDGSNMTLEVTGAHVTVQKIAFILDSLEKRRPALVDTGDFKLVYDSNTIILIKDITFDAITGAVTPSLDSLRLPILRYAGFKLYLHDTNANYQDPPLVVSGNFFYHDTIRTFMFNLYSKDPSITYSEEVEELSAVGKNRMLLQLDARNWMAGVNLKTCLDMGNVVLNSSGNLILGDRIVKGPCTGIEQALRANILSSGRLAIFPGQ